MVYFARPTRLSRLVMALLLLTGCSGVSNSSQKSCEFTYTQEVIDNLVLPVLRGTYGENYTIFDLKRPGILEKDGSIELIFGQSRIDVIDAPNFVVVIDPCARTVIKAYETSPFPVDAPTKRG